jgi:hypothetical protein
MSEHPEAPGAARTVWSRHSRMPEATALTDAAMLWLRNHYEEFTFSVERDLVWTLQNRLRLLVGEARSPLRVFNDYPMIAGARRSLSADLALVAPGNTVEIALEFKYEPCHKRADVLASKLPVVTWAAVVHDLERIRRFVELGKAKAARSYFVDEGGYFARRHAPPGSSWASWGGDRRVLIAQV